MGENVIEAVKKCVLSHFQQDDVQSYLSQFRQKTPSS